MTDIVEYVEKTYGIELLEYQKIYLRALYDEYKYLKQNNIPICKELLSNGTTINCNK